MILVRSNKTNIFSFFVFLIFDDVYIEYTKHNKKGHNSKNLYSKTILDELDLMRKTVIIQ